MSDRAYLHGLARASWAVLLTLAAAGCPTQLRSPGDRCNDDADGGSCDPAPAPCICTREYAPVCGEDGKTYGNACEARCAGESIDHKGECDKGCICTLEYAPVCGKDGTTYGNACEARCADQPIDHKGECDAGCVCTAQYDPVCGKDGKTYGNRCQAECEGAAIAHEGECKPLACKTNADCNPGEVCHPDSHECSPECTIACLRYEPVCGSDGVTYGCGKADAYCHGADVVHDGECKGASGCDYEGTHYAVGESFPASDGCNKCSCDASGQAVCTLALCACDYNDPRRSYVERSPEACSLVRFTCVKGKQYFADDCGCGCESEPAAACKVGGCSRQICQDANAPDAISTCEHTEAYDCYQTATCEPQPSGKCGWTDTPELRKCLDNAR